MRLPAIKLRSSEGDTIALHDLNARTIVFVYPSIGGIDDSLIEEWTAIPGARGCTPEACGFRDQAASFRAAQVEVLGLSGQRAAEQRRAVERLHLPYRLLSDERMQLAESIGLPTFDFHGRTYYKRVTLIVSGATIEGVLYPAFPPNQAAGQALGWLAENPSD
jgi:peroxiredoxin